MSAAYEALGDKLSNTDPISNAVLISGLDFQRDGVNLLLAGRYPLTCLGAYVHESLHHHCFATPVGNAIAHLYHRAFLRAFEVLTNEESPAFDEYHVLEDMVRIETILHIMRPLAEGIALFGEFHAWPATSKSLSPVFKRTALAFARITGDWESMPLDKLLRNVLIRWRLLPSTRKRRENLLMQGFTTLHGGYLPGYFLVKNLQHALFRHTHADLLLDSEFYLHFLIQWFYADYGLVAALIDEAREVAPFTSESIESRDSVNAISKAFQKRLVGLFSVTEDQLKRLDLQLSTPGVTPWAELELGMPASEGREVAQRLMESMTELLDGSGASSEDDGAMRALCSNNTFRRNYMCVGSFEETIEIEPDRRVKLARFAGADVPIMMFPDSAKPGPYKGPATFDVFQSDFSEKVFFTVYADGELVTVSSFTDGFDEEKAQLEQFNLSTAFCQVTKDIMQGSIDDALGRGGAGVLRKHYRAQSERLADGMYGNWCGALMEMFGKEAEIPARAGVLLELCDGDLPFLRALAAIGCTSGLLADAGQIQEGCNESGISTEDFFKRAEAVEANHGLRLLHPMHKFYHLLI